MTTYESERERILNLRRDAASYRSYGDEVRAQWLEAEARQIERRLAQTPVDELAQPARFPARNTR